MFLKLTISILPEDHQCVLYTLSKIMHNGVKAGELQIDQNSSDTVIFAVPKNILIDL